MYIIHKFPFSGTKSIEMMLEPSARPVFVGLDSASGYPAIWFERIVNAEDLLAMKRVHFEIYGTGHEIPEKSVYVGNVVQAVFVWHIYQIQVKKYTEAELQEMGDL